MKKNGKKVVFITASALLSFGTVSAVAESTPISHTQVFAEEEEGFETLESEWYRIKANATDPEKDADGKITKRGDANLEVYISPEIQDYRKVTRDSIDALMDQNTGLVGAIKYILAKQVNFIQPVDTPEDREEDTEITDAIEKRDAIFDQYVKSAFKLFSEDAPKENDILEFETTMAMSWEDVEREVSNKELPTGPRYLRANLTFIAGNRIEGDYDEKLAKLAELCGVTLDVSGEVVSVDVDGKLGKAIKIIYDSSTRSLSEALENKIKGYVTTIFKDARKALEQQIVPQSLVLAEAFVLLQDTSVPHETIITILNNSDVDKDVVKDAIVDCISNDEIPTDTVQYLLETYTADTVRDLCESIELSKEDIKECIEEMTNERLMEITKDLSPEALDNIRIILGTANDNEETRSVKRAVIDFDGQYGEFGNDLVNIVLGRMTLKDMIDAVEAVWFCEPDELDPETKVPSAEVLHPIYSYGYNAETNEKEDGRHIYLNSIFSWFNDHFPKFSVMRNWANNEFKKEIHLEILSPLNGESIYVNFTIGFMEEKNCNLERKVLGLLDDTFDLNQCEIIDNTLTLDLAYRPKALTNLYSYLVTSDIINNTEDNRTKAELFELLYLPFGEMKDRVAAMEVADFLADLKNIDYEEAVAAFLDCTKLNEIFAGIELTDDSLEKIIGYVKTIVLREHYFTFENFCKIIDKVLGEGKSAALAGTKIETIINDLNAWLKEIKEQNISLESLKDIQNDDIYGYIDNELTAKGDTVHRFLRLIRIALKIIPKEFNHLRIMDLFNEETRTLSLPTEPFDIPWDTLLNALPFKNEIRAVMSDLIRGEDRFDSVSASLNIDMDARLQDSKVDTDKVYPVYYKDEFEGETIDIAGFLPAGAKVKDFAPNKIGSKRIAYWVKEGTEERVDVMPSESITLSAVYVKTLDFTNVKWNEPTTFTYDGSEHEVTIDESTLPMPEGLDEIFSINYIDNKKSEIGSYTARATVTLIDDECYELGVGEIPACSWSITEPPVVYLHDFESVELDGNQNPLVKVHLDTGFINPITLNAIKNLETFGDPDFDTLYGEKAELAVAYDLEFRDGQILIDIEDTGKIKVLIPEEIIDQKILIIAVNENGEFITPEFDIIDGYAVFSTNTFVKVGIIKAAEAVVDVTSNPLPLIILIIGLTNLVLALVYLVKKVNEDPDIEADEYVENPEKMKEAKKAAKELKNIHL